MATQNELNLEQENDDALQTQNETETQAEEVEQYDPEAEAKQAEEYWKEFTSQGEETDEEPETEKEGEKPEESQEEEAGQDEGADESVRASEVTKEDERKAAKVFQQAEEAKQGKANYIDHELINSIEDPELRQRVWLLANTAQSHYGRLYQREQEVRQLKNQITQLQAEQEVAKGSATTKQQESAVDKATEDKIARLKRDYPDLADSIEAMFNTQLETKTKELTELFNSNLVPMKQRMEEESRQHEIQTLEQAANDIFQTEVTGVSYREVVNSPDFQSWLDSQDESIQKLANSDRAAEVVSVLKNFEYDYSREYQKAYGKTWIEAVTEGNKASNQKESTASTADPELTKKAEDIKQRRDTRKKAAVTGVNPSRSSTSNDANVDAQTYFDHFAKQSRYAR
jgi:hypothetical protein